MKVEASSYDQVEFSPKYIKPGEFINTPKKIKKIKIGTKKKIEMRSPSRIAFGVLDHSALKFTDSQDYKPGEMVFACNEYFFAEVELTKNPETIIKSN